LTIKFALPEIPRFKLKPIIMALFFLPVVI